MSIISDPLGEFKGKISKSLQDTLSRMGCNDVNVVITTPPSDMGDFSFACFMLAKRLKSSPNQIAQDIASNLENKIEGINQIIAKDGYVNFYINPSSLIELTLGSVINKGDLYGTFEKTGKRILLEHTSANPTGPLHIGRARNPIIGDTLARILKYAGHVVVTEYYVNDVGRQAATLIWGVKNQTNIGKPNNNNKPDHEYVLYYQFANSEVQKTGAQVNEQVDDILKKIESGDPEISKIAKDCINDVMKGITETLSSLNIKIDNFVYESSFIKRGDVSEIVSRLKSLPESKEEDGAYYLDLENYGFHGEDTKFFYKRKGGTTLYTTRDIAYHIDKFKRCNMVINILGEDQKRAMEQLKITLNLLGAEDDASKRLNVVYYSFVSLPEGRMSTRTGKVVYIDDLITEALDRAYQEVKKRRASELTEEQMRQIAGFVGIGAIRYNIIRVQAEKQIVFRWEDALNFEGNSAPFIQYAHARSCSILKKAGISLDKIEENKKTWMVEKFSKLLLTKQELVLVRKIADFPSVIAECGSKNNVHILASYAHELADSFNQFYRDCNVINSDGDLKTGRIAIVNAVRVTLKNALDCLGIHAPEEM